MIPAHWEGPRRIAELEDALERCRKLAAFWASMPGSVHGLPANCMTNDCAAFWLDAAITGEEVLP